MLKLLISGFFLSITFMTNAAIVQPTELSDRPLQFLDHAKVKTSPATDPQSSNSQDTTTVQPTESPDKSTQLIEQKKNNIPSALHHREASHNAENIRSQNTPTNALDPKKNLHQSSLYSSLKSFAKMLINEYRDNELVQEALSTLYEIKQLWDKADSLVNDFVYDTFFALNLDDFLEHELAQTQQSLQISNIYILSKKDLNLSNQNRKINSISFNQLHLVQTGTNTGTTSQQLESTFLHNLFQIRTLYYLAALLIFLSILQAIINFISRLFP